RWCRHRSRFALRVSRILDEKDAVVAFAEEPFAVDTPQFVVVRSDQTVRAAAFKLHDLQAVRPGTCVVTGDLDRADLRHERHLRQDLPDAVPMGAQLSYATTFTAFPEPCAVLGPASQVIVECAPTDSVAITVDPLPDLEPVFHRSTEHPQLLRYDGAITRPTARVSRRSGELVSQQK